jgi:hypothetical protein
MLLELITAVHCATLSVVVVARIHQLSDKPELAKRSKSPSRARKEINDPKGEARVTQKFLPTDVDLHKVLAPCTSARG